jgi:tRNA pseudouridine55 synthase
MGRDVHGILLIDKPLGITSNQALIAVKRLYNAKKAGHTGSLDPLACGMLPMCLGEATKFSEHLLAADKQYWVQAKLGIRTTTGDGEGEILTRKKVVIEPLQLQEALNAFLGTIVQIPSMYSAIKFQGKPLYAYARAGIEIERQSRAVSIKTLELLDFTEDTCTLLVRCSKGTYIRTLIEDIGEKLQCGAYVTQLRRIFVEPYQNNNMVTLAELRELKDNDQLLDALLLPIESALGNLPEVILAPSLAFYLQRGQPVIVSKAPTTGLVQLFTEQGMFLGVGEILGDGRVAPKRLLRSPDHPRSLM